MRVAVEFRHRSWHCEEIFTLLEAHGAVKAYAAPQPSTRNSEKPVPVQAGGEPDSGAGGAGGAGLAYLKRRRAQLTARESSRQAAVAGARAVHADLSGRVAQARLHPPQSAQLSENRMPMLLNAAYLLDASASAGFRRRSRT
jgi:hypothetical protein